MRNRIEREKNTVEKMIKLYCKQNHKFEKGLCEECTELLNYSKARLEHCKFGINKPVCGKCTIHCYRKDMQDKIKSIMKSVGPKMLFVHPISSIQHFIDSFTK
ncbi:nitrous oxide-stimulated promoter family protein [Clostridium sediminicola]|uniref:nitrous oxide-stimulated promoter family protein n=1 Tax=Clostridium sediminicola TaxID=3114879 RepID=UPI003D174479